VEAGAPGVVGAAGQVAWQVLARVGDVGEALGELAVEPLEGGALEWELVLDVVPDELVPIPAGTSLWTLRRARALVTMAWRRAVR